MDEAVHLDPLPLVADVVEEPIFALAVDCGRLFEEHLKIEDTTGSNNLTPRIEEYQRLFWKWAQYVGVFAARKASLDWRVRRDTTHRDLFLLALDMLRSNLNQLLPSDARSFTSAKSDSSDESDAYDAACDGIEDSISQLNSLGISIRQPVTSRLEAKVKAFAAKPKTTMQLNDFEMLAILVLERLYPYAAPSLQQRLVKHMVGLHSRLLYWESHAKKLSAEQIVRRLPKPQNEPSESGPLPTGVVDQSSPNYQAPGDEHARRQTATVSDTEATTIPSQHPFAGPRRNAEVKKTRSGGASTVVTSKVDIPPPPKEEDDHMCWYCRKVHSADEYSSELWWRNHTNGDLLPYVCLSDHCLGIKMFSSSGDWARHMTAEHGDDWSLNIHESLIWRCDQTKSGHDDVLHIRTSEDLTDHVRTVHKGSAPADASPSMFLLQGEDIISKSPSAVTCPLCYRGLQIKSAEKSQTAPTKETAKRAAKVRFTEDVEAAHLDHENASEDMSNSGTATVDKNMEIKRLLTSHIAEHLQRLALLTVRFNTGGDGAEDKKETELSSEITTPIPDIATSVESTSTVDLIEDEGGDIEDLSDSKSHHGAMLINQIAELDDLTFTESRGLTDEQKKLYFDTLSNMTGLASSYKDQGHWEEAEAQEVCVMETRKRVFGEEHPDTLDIMTSLALTYQNQDRPQKAAEERIQKAIELLEHVVAVQERVRGQEHPDGLASHARHHLEQAYKLRDEIAMAIPDMTVPNHESFAYSGGNPLAANLVFNSSADPPQPEIFKKGAGHGTRTIRLIECGDGNIKLTGYPAHDTPRYAILSHTWGSAADEVTFEDLVKGTGKEKTGYQKIEFCAVQARSDGLQYFWVDTCCIDKSNKVELSEAINSMFRWYQNAARCYVYLSDISDTQQSELGWESAFRASKWFTRGWTLQELLAPASVEFFTKEGRRLGDKKSLEQQMHEVTGIAIPALRGNALTQFSVKQRFQWAKTRETTEKEDWAYCLLGIFGISMALIYGEGKTQAIHRLQEKINKNQECLKDLRNTDPRDDKQRIEQTKGGLLRDSYKWILENHDFQRWRDEDQSRLLWVRGDPGKGKTMLLCGIIDELQVRPATNTAYFFCQVTDSRINNATAVLRGLIYSLVDQQQSLLSHLRKKYNQVGKQLFEDANAWIALTTIFNNILQDPGLNPTYLLIDALDECSTDLPQLLDLIVHMSTAHPTIKWIVSSRNWPIIEEKLGNITKGASLSLELYEASISAAVRTYIGYKVDQLAKDKKYEEDLRNHVNQYLVDRANSTFLWVALVCQELARPQVKKRHTITKLNTFPPGLDSLYKRMIRYIQSSEDATLCMQILAVVSIAFRPITLSELMILVETSEEIDNDRETFEELIKLCGSFLTLQGDNVSFIHQSAKDFLSEKEPGLLFPSGKEVEHRSVLLRSIKAMSQTLRRDMYSLKHPGTPIEEVQLKRPSPDPLAPIRYACTYWVDHLLEIQSHNNVDIIDSFLRKHFLHWFEALSLLRSTSEGVLAVIKLVWLLERVMPASYLLHLVRDFHRFARFYSSIVEKAPLQIYSSALIFSPTESLTRKLFRNEEPDWIIKKPLMAQDWNACTATLEGHSGWVTSVAFSPDGRYIASGSYDNTIKLWDIASGACTATLKGHSSSVNSIAFSPDNGCIALGSDNGTVKLWDIISSACTATLVGHSGSVNSVAFSPNSNRIASGSDDSTIKLWDIASGACTATLKGHSSSVNSVAFSPDSGRVASGSDDSTIKLWDTTSGACIVTLEGHSGSVYSIAFSPDSGRVASGSDDSTIKLWDITSGAYISTLEGHNGSVYSIAFSPNSRYITSGSYDNTVKFWDIKTNAYTATFEGHSDSVTSIAFSPDASCIASGASDKTVKIWDAYSGVGLSLVSSLHSPILHDTAAFEQTNHLGYSISPDRTWIAWNSENVLWLPFDFRPKFINILSRGLAVACFTDRTWSIEFSLEKFPTSR